MKKFCTFLFFLLAFPALGQVTNAVDWAQFLAKQDLVWTNVPQKWEEAPFMGNGNLGAMIFEEPDKSLGFQMGRSEVNFRKNRIPIGDLCLHTVGTINGISMRQVLWDAEVIGTLKTSAGEISFRSFTPSEQMVQLIELHPGAAEAGCQFIWVPGLAVNPRLIFKHTKLEDADKNPAPVLSEEGVFHLASQPLTTGGGHVTAWTETKLPDQGRLIWLAVGYSTTDLDAARKEAINDITRAQTLGLAALTEQHRAWWHNYYQESFLSIPDARLESFYWIQMYKLASATRADKVAIDLMGPWTRSTPWTMIWWNLNIQLTYWPVLASNRLELGESLCRMLDKGTDNLIKNAGPYSSDSAAIGRTSTYDCISPAGSELGNLPWVMHNYYLQYRYSMDDEMLRNRVFPLLKRSINYYRHFLETGPDGKLHIKTGYSPEYPGQPKVNPDCNYDLSLLRWGCQTLLAICARLKIDDELIPQWKDILNNLTPYPTDAKGLRISALVPFAESHRHYSHLFMIFPLHLMSLEDPANKELVVKSLNHWMELKKGLAGFSYSGAASISTLLGKGDDAAGYLNTLLNTKIQPNTMYEEAGPVIETPLSAAASIHDMLISSWGDRIRVFPAIPTTWKDVSFYHLRTEGAFLVSALRQNGETKMIEIKSLAGEPCRLWTDMADPVADGSVPMKSLGQGLWEIGLKKNESVVIHPSGSPPVLSITEVESSQGVTNYFGSKK